MKDKLLSKSNTKRRLKKILKGGLDNELSNRGFFNSKIDLDYIIHAHGHGHEGQSFVIPDNTHIYVYGPLGTCLVSVTPLNDVCEDIGTYHNVYGPGDEFPELRFSRDEERNFRSGIKRCDDNFIVMNFDKSDEKYYLSEILQELHSDRISYLRGDGFSEKNVGKSKIHVHIMACTEGIPEKLRDYYFNKSTIANAYDSDNELIVSKVRPPNGINDVYDMKSTHTDKYNEIKPAIDRLLRHKDYDWQYNQLYDIVINTLNDTREEHIERLIGLSVLMHKRDKRYYKMAKDLYQIIFREQFPGAH